MSEIHLGIPGLSDYKEIGAGGFATVYSAFEEDAGRQVAVKVLAAVDERGRRRFERERRSMGQTTAHDNIVTMFRSGYTDPGDRPYLVLEHMSGGSLQDHLETRGPFPIDEAVALVAPVAKGLGFAHDTGILHKDIKPANILISATGVPKLSDFGVAAVRDATGTSQVAFSLAYTAPETFDAVRSSDGEMVDPRQERSDLYSLAATLYALITGDPPFRADSQAGLMRQILVEPTPPVGHHALDAFFETALAKSPDERYSTTAHFVDALTPIADPTGQPQLQDGVIGDNITSSSSETAGEQQAERRTTKIASTGVIDTQVQSFEAKPTGQSTTVVAPPPEWEVESQPSERSTIRVRLLAAVLAIMVAAIVIARVVGGDAGDNADPSVYTEHTGPVWGVTELANGRIASAGIDHTVQIWDPDNPDTTIATYTGHFAPVKAITELSDGNIATASWDRTVQIWDPNNPDTTIATYTGHFAPVKAITELSDGNIATASQSTVQIWDPYKPDGTFGTYTGHDDQVNAVIELSNGNIATAGNDTVQIWDPDNRDTIATYTGHNGPVEALIELFNGNIATASQDQTVQVWDPNNPDTTIATYTGHDDQVNAVIELSNGNIATAGNDTVQIWDPDNRDTIATYTGHNGPIEAITELSDGRIATASQDQTAQVWDPSGL